MRSNTIFASEKMPLEGREKESEKEREREKEERDEREGRERERESGWFPMDTFHNVKIRQRNIVCDVRVTANLKETKM